MKDINLGYNAQHGKKIIYGLKDKIAELIENKEYLLYLKKPSLEAKYIDKLGKYEERRLKLDLNVKILKKELETRKKLLLKEKDAKEDEGTDIFDFEFKVLNNRIRELIEQIGQSQKILNKPKLSTEDIIIRKKLYIKLARLLHSDINKVNMENKSLWNKAVEAYKTDDIDRLKDILNIINDKNKHTEDDNVKTQIDMISEIEELKKIFYERNKEIEDIKRTFPFNFENEINDSEWNKNKVGQIISSIEKLKVEERKLNVVLSEFRVK
ncbi:MULTISPECIES: hypothetical protein [Clostridium]|uniref:hypothetical protein n=1 Tax=Clostridium TaxID=1485 RepID=UPI00082435C2|nr:MULTISPECIES: hypothetical protein [Clostridium]PJI06755.1 hypothetical protein CUB90_02225 [Clostridium sp. CT7]